MNEIIVQLNLETAERKEGHASIDHDSVSNGVMSVSHTFLSLTNAKVGQPVRVEL
jgi:hypothetical protein